MNYELEDRVDSLETLLGQFIVQTNTTLKRLGRGLEQLAKEMREFKDEMKEFKDEMKEFKDEMREFKDEMKEFKDEMKDFKDEMKEYKDRQDVERRRMNRQWGDLANKWGTLVEDLVLPSIPQIIVDKFNTEITDIMIRRKRRMDDGLTKEFDLIAISDKYIFLNSTKSTLRSQYVDDFVNEINLFWEMFPEYRNKKLIGILASLNIDKSVMAYAEKKGFLVLGVGIEIMEIKNKDDFEPKIWTYKANSKA